MLILVLRTSARETLSLRGAANPTLYLPRYFVRPRPSPATCEFPAELGTRAHGLNHEASSGKKKLVEAALVLSVLGVRVSVSVRILFRVRA